MIGAQANSSGSNWDPLTKIEHYRDAKADAVSVGSLKFRIMMQCCLDNHRDMLEGRLDRPEHAEWNVEDMQAHQRLMMKILRFT